MIDSAAIIGGGPAGLYLARLLKLRHPLATIDVYEQIVPEETFGFGVGIARKTQVNLKSADPGTHEDIVANSWPHEMSLNVSGQQVFLHQESLLAIERSTLLAVLRRHAEAAGVQTWYGSRVDAADLSAQIIVAADGVSSATRESLFEHSGTSERIGSSLYLWAGTDFSLRQAMFTPAHTEHGTFVAHAYPYSAHRSTFLVETSEATWRAAGLDAGQHGLAPEESDEVSLSFLREAFREQLDGRRLIGNRSRWLRFRTLRCETWHRGNVVLLGDAAHTAHYSIGSGTKLAMEDAIALDVAIAGAGSIEEAFASYEAARRPAVEHLQQIATYSEEWWDSFVERMDLPISQLLLAYMTRAGKVSVQRFLRSNPANAIAGLSEFAGHAPGPQAQQDLNAWILSQPLSKLGLDLPTRITTYAEVKNMGLPLLELTVAWDSAWGQDAERLLSLVRARTADSATVVLLTGDEDDDACQVRLHLAERVRRIPHSLVVTEGSRDRIDDLAAGVAANRTDLVTFTPRAVSEPDPHVQTSIGRTLVEFQATS